MRSEAEYGVYMRNLAPSCAERTFELSKAEVLPYLISSIDKDTRKN